MLVGWAPKFYLFFETNTNLILFRLRKYALKIVHWNDMGLIYILCALGHWLAHLYTCLCYFLSTKVKKFRWHNFSPFLIKEAKQRVIFVTILTFYIWKWLLSFITNQQVTSAWILECDNIAISKWRCYL